MTVFTSTLLRCFTDPENESNDTGVALGFSHTSSISCVSDNSMSAAPRLFERFSSVLKYTSGIHRPGS